MESDDIWNNFCLYFTWKTGRIIEDTKDNKIEFKACIEDGNLNVGYEQLDQFFEKYVDFKNHNVLIECLTITG